MPMGPRQQKGQLTGALLKKYCELGPMRSVCPRAADAPGLCHGFLVAGGIVEGCFFVRSGHGHQFYRITAGPQRERFFRCESCPARSRSLVALVGTTSSSRQAMGQVILASRLHALGVF